MNCTNGEDVGTSFPHPYYGTEGTSEAFFAARRGEPTSRLPMGSGAIYQRSNHDPRLCPPGHTQSRRANAGALTNMAAGSQILKIKAAQEVTSCAVFFC
jgi:hypothetical protein